MHTTNLTLLTIVGEAILKDRLLAELERAGARGHTLTECEGAGSRHRRVSETLGANIKLETIVSSVVADRLLATHANDYFPKFAVIAYLSPVAVVRGEKYI
ncbi:MAG: P-II family nitrogen regulator [Planctomycetaceae bacterium]